MNYLLLAVCLLCARVDQCSPQRRGNLLHQIVDRKDCPESHAKCTHVLLYTFPSLTRVRACTKIEEQSLIAMYKRCGHIKVNIEHMLKRLCHYMYEHTCTLK